VFAAGATGVNYDSGRHTTTKKRVTASNRSNQLKKQQRKQKQLKIRFRH